MADCIFCKIVDGKIPSEKLFEDENCICINDIHPQAKIHLLVVSKKHLASLDTAFPDNVPGETQLVGNLLKAATTVARKQGLLPGGFRTVINTGSNGGQTVFHLHIHVLGGDRLTEKMA